jgi:hypothetical protein
VKTARRYSEHDSAADRVGCQAKLPGNGPGVVEYQADDLAVEDRVRLGGSVVPMWSDVLSARVDDHHLMEGLVRPAVQEQPARVSRVGGGALFQERDVP